MNDRRELYKMILRAKNHQQKKDTAYHVVNGTVCKNCKHYENGRCYCEVYIKRIYKYDYCNKFEKQGELI